MLEKKPQKKHLEEKAFWTLNGWSEDKHVFSPASTMEMFCCPCLSMFVYFCCDGFNIFQIKDVGLIDCQVDMNLMKKQFVAAFFGRSWKPKRKGPFSVIPWIP